MAYIKLSRKSVITVLVSINAALVLLYVSGWSSTTTAFQNKQVIIRDLPDSNEPIEISMRVKDKPVTFGEGFEEDADWLKNLTLTVKNTSNKPIAYVRLDIIFPETKSTGPALLHQLFLGHRSDVKSTLKQPSLDLLPGNSLDVSLASEHRDIKELIEGRHSPIAYIKEMRVALGEVLFTDGTLYSGGRIFKPNPDPTNPRKWIKAH
jgi:hypothetical protein